MLVIFASPVMDMQETASNAADFPFESLPPELRHRIYEEVLVCDSELGAGNIDDLRKDLPNIVHARDAWQAIGNLALCSRQIYRELKDLTTEAQIKKLRRLGQGYSQLLPTLRARPHKTVVLTLIIHISYDTEIGSQSAIAFTRALTDVPGPLFAGRMRIATEAATFTHGDDWVNDEIWAQYDCKALSDFRKLLRLGVKIRREHSDVNKEPQALFGSRGYRALRLLLKNRQGMATEVDD
ncbi:Hypothetical predicted protein [Lecanosticta acicola]|uniref:Uncharacterized protein n=1 Tax=Lecanosticta acicola TaxID=111012 RepID=A0AAI8Z2V6_9PEZI|nr:Hypothetical predicted protein [Lecanosticta acicola]